MNKFLCFSVLLTGLLAGQMNAFPSNSRSNMMEIAKVQSRNVRLAGGFNVRTRMGAKKPVEVFQNTSTLDVIFNMDLGNLNIRVVNQYGYPVYQTVVRSTKDSSLTIITRGWSRGGYTIYITNEDGDGVEGEIEI